MHNKLKFLTDDDYQLLLEKAQITTYQKNTNILEEGHLSTAIYILRKGSARVEHSSLGKGVAISFLFPGDIFGEMSFIEDTPASATIIAEEEVEVFVLENTTLYSLLVSIPGLSARFYQSIASNLSYRLRETSSLVSSLLNKVSFQTEFHTRRTGYLGQDKIPAELISEVELFKDNLLEIEQSLRANKINSEEAQHSISNACNLIFSSLREYIIQNQEIEKAIGTYFFRETFSIFMLSSLIDSAFRKPQSYAGDSYIDFYIIELLSQNEPEGDGHLGIYIDRWIRSMPSCLALKNRGAIISATIKKLASNWTSDALMPITNLASGSASEILDFYLNNKSPNVHVTCIDMNYRHLSSAANLARKLGFIDFLTFIQDNILLLSQGYHQIDISPQQMIYSVSISNYLQDSELVNVLNWIYQHLLPGGTVVLGNFHAANPDRVLLKHILEWHLVYRTAKELENVFAQSKFNSLPLEIHSDDYGVELFVVCTKAWEI